MEKPWILSMILLVALVVSIFGYYDLKKKSTEEAMKQKARAAVYEFMFLKLTENWGPEKQSKILEHVDRLANEVDESDYEILSKK